MAVRPYDLASLSRYNSSEEESDEAAGSRNGSRLATRQWQTRQVWHLKARFGLRVVKRSGSVRSRAAFGVVAAGSEIGLRMVKRSGSVQSGVAFRAMADEHSRIGASRAR